MSPFIDNQNWRYATKKFDASKKITAAEFEILKEAIRLSPSSYGLQPYKVLIIENPETRAKLQPASWGQSQIVDASHIIVFANYTKLDNDDIDAYIENVTSTREIPLEAVSGYADFMKGAIAPKSDEEKSLWNQKQTYIALANLMNAAAELKIDVTPMEGFVPQQYNEILGLDKQHLNAAVVAAVGYRHEEDATQHYKKVRKSKEDLFINL
jgi:nitroreductase